MAGWSKTPAAEIANQAADGAGPIDCRCVERTSAGRKKALLLADPTNPPDDRAKRDRRGKPSAEPPTRYFFHLVKGPQRIDDRMGVELHQEAVASAAVLDVVHEIWPGTADRRAWTGWSVQIVDPHGILVRLLPL